MSPSITREFLTSDQLWKLCRDAARFAVRAPYGPDDRAECAMDMFSETVETVAADVEPVRHGSPAEVLKFIARAERAAMLRPQSVGSVWMPLATDDRFTFTALKNRAMNWRRTRDRQRSRDELMAGAAGISTRDDRPEDSAPPAAYLAAGAAQSAAVARAAAGNACRALNMPTGTDAEPSPVFCLLYQWARDVEPERAASELGIGWAAWRKRTSRAGAAVRETYSLAELVSELCGSPVFIADEVLFSLRDESRDAHGRTRMLADVAGAPHWRDHLGDREPRPETVAAARAKCAVRHIEPSPTGETVTDELWSQSRARLGSAITSATGRTSRADVGRTSGKAPEKYAPREVRLGKNAG